jgi:DNA-binding SARP family transcriptional activator/tetratricopeptide (TPR) repeat protein
MIVLRALGTAEIDTGVATLTPSQEIVFAAALYLIVERGKRVSRARLASLLWPRVPEKARAHRLRQTLLQLKKLGVMVRANRDNLELSEIDARSDIEDLSGSDLAPVLSKDSLEFLPGYVPRLSESLREWVDTQREQVQGLATRRLVEGLNGARQRGDWSTCDKFALHCHKLDPLNETAVIVRAEAAAIRGNKMEAVTILDRYLEEMGSDNKYLTLPAIILRKRITEKVSERSVSGTQECAFVGRSLETERLNLRLTTARTGKGGGCLVVGEAGIGKTRLALEIAKRAELDGVVVERAVCRRSDLDRPLSVFVDLVPRLRELRGALGCSSETITILKRLTEIDTTTPDDILNSDSATVYARTRRALFDLFDAIADEQCVLIIVEDVQWLDPVSATLLGAMIPWANTKKLFFLLNQRADINPLTKQISEVDLPILTLSRLATSSARTLLTAIFGDQSGAPNEDLIERLLAIGEGNPFFLQELGKNWIERGGQHELPPSIAAVVDDRLSHLSPEALQVLQACAVLGLNATIERIERLLEYKSHRLLSAVQELCVTGMLHEEFDESTDIADRVSVRHDLLATAALRRLAKTTLTYLHRRAGAVLQEETLGGDTSTALLWACALHWRNAGDRERSFGAARACAEHLLEVGLPLDSAYAFERTLDYCVTDEQRLTILSRLAVARQMHGDWVKAKEALQRFRRIRSATAPHANPHDEAEFALFDSTWRASLESSALLGDLLRCITSREASAGHRVACGLLALKIAGPLNEIATMEEVYQTIVPLLDSSRANSCVRSEIDMVFHSACGDVGKLIAATKAFLLAVRNETNLLTLSRGLVNAATAYRLAGEREEAEALLREVLDHALAHGLSSRAMFACYSLIRLYLAAGDILRAREALDRSEGLADFGEDMHLISDRNYLQARVALEEENIEAACAYYALTLAETHPNQSVNRRSSVAALGIMVGVSNRMSFHSLRLLVADLESMHIQNRASGWQDFEAQALFVGLTACGETEKADRLLNEYVTMYRRERWPLPRRLSAFRQRKSQPSAESLEARGDFQRAAS